MLKRIATTFLCSLCLAQSEELKPTASEPVQTVRVAAISYVPKKLDLAGNADRLEAAFREAAAGGARIAVAPEGALDGYVINDILAGTITEEQLAAVAIPIDDPILQRFQALANSLNLCLAFGFAERIGEEIFNCAVFLDDQGRIAGKYHKMQFDEGYHPEWWWNRLGAQSRAFETPFGRAGFLICNDRWNPDLARIPVLDGAEFLMIPAYGSRSQAQDDAVRSRARENGVPVIEANVGVTLIVGNKGMVLAQQKEESAITYSEIQIRSRDTRDPKARDAAEQAFLIWRKDEMSRRYAKRPDRSRTGTRD